MKKCINCGAEIEEKNNFCPHCGTKCEDRKDVEPIVFKPSESVSDNRDEPAAQSNVHPMKWHNFLMVIMILGGIVTIANGLNMMMGSEYLSSGYNSSQVYRVFPGLKGCDTFYGIALIALGVFEFIVRNRLNNFRANGPTSMKAMYILSIIASLIYIAWASSTTGVSLFNSSNMGSLVSSVLFLIINSVYYSKRGDLFVN